MKEAAAIRVGPWRVWLPNAGGPAEAAGWIATVERLAAAGACLHRSKHAETYRCASATGDVYVKIYRRYRRRTAAKDQLRPSKARNVLRMSRELAAAGFRVPRVLAAGEERRGLRRRGAWVVTAALEGEPLADHLAALHQYARGLVREGPESTSGAAATRDAAPAPLCLTPGGAPRSAFEARPPLARRRHVLRKRALLAVIGAELARLHAAGFVAGDLVPANVWTVAAPDGIRIALLDHDRTRAGQGPTRWWRARRNLVQLNRVVLPGVTATDRLRVYRAYANGRGWSRQAARRRLLWVVAKTIERRRRFDGVEIPPHARVDFRELMRAGGPYAPGLAASLPVGQVGAHGGVRRRK